MCCCYQPCQLCIENRSTILASRILCDLVTRPCITRSDLILGALEALAALDGPLATIPDIYLRHVDSVRVNLE